MTHQPLAWYGGSYYYDEPDPPTASAPDLPGSEAPATAAWMLPPQPSRHGLVMGRFAPPHQGHQYLLSFAAQQVQQLTVVLRALPEDGIDPELRLQWLHGMAPEARVLRIQGDAEQPILADWVNALGEILPEAVDVLFSNEPQHEKFAALLGARFVCVDPERSVVPVSATQIRQNPLLHWEHLAHCARPYFARTIRIVGAEGSGKTTLSRKLAAAFRTVVVPEFAALIAARKGKTLQPPDLVEWAQAHLAATAALRRQAQRFLFLDTDLQTVAFWFDRLFGSAPDWLRQQAAAQSYDLTILLEPRLAGLSALQTSERTAFHRDWLAAAPQALVLNGSEDDVLARCLTAIQDRFGITAPSSGPG